MEVLAPLPSCAVRIAFAMLTVPCTTAETPNSTAVQPRFMYGAILKLLRGGSLRGRASGCTHHRTLAGYPGPARYNTHTMARRVCSVVVASVALAMVVGCCCAASDVVQLTSANFEKMVLKSQDYWLVEFYAVRGRWRRWCLWL